MNNESSKNISFWKLLSNYKIEIPKIQRDYAQGRTDKKTTTLRENFLNALIEAIKEKDKKLELDFVYGDLKGDTLQPLDGQQRLTTLFLLHWYIALKSGKLEENKELLKKFTYETRISSREFCEQLVINKIGKGKTISEQIKDSTWFFISWKKDPTIKGMLCMLDAIEEKLKNKNHNSFWEKLTSDNPPITFYFMALNNVGLTDDLYIKMNARGKQLTAFENFKAAFKKHCEENSFDMNFEETFFYKIDTDWTDLFWKYKDEENKIDNQFMRFIAEIAMECYAETENIYEDKKEIEIVRKKLKEKHKKENITENAIKTERIEERIKTLFNNPNEVSSKDYPTEDSFNKLKNRFEKYAENNNDKLSVGELSMWDFLSEENTLFSDLLDENITTYKKRVLFYAQSKYLLNNKVNEKTFFSWMRVIRNIVQNSTIDSAINYINAIKLIKELSENSHNIYDFLADDKNEIESNFAKEQVKEEREKAKNIKEDYSWEKKITDAENYAFFKGKINFLYREFDGEPNWQRFDKRFENAKKYFNENGVQENYKNDAKLLRSLIFHFNKWAMFWECTYDNTSESWMRFLTDEKWREPIIKLLEIDDLEEIDLSIENELTEFEEGWKERQEAVYHDLYMTNLLSNLVGNGFKLNWNYQQYALYPYNARADWKKYVIGHKRNKILSNLLKEGKITTEQHIENTIFFWGWDILFTYKNTEFNWNTDNNIYVHKKWEISYKDEDITENNLLDKLDKLIL